MVSPQQDPEYQAMVELFGSGGARRLAMMAIVTATLPVQSAEDAIGAVHYLLDGPDCNGQAGGLPGDNAQGAAWMDLAALDHAIPGETVKMVVGDAVYSRVKNSKGEWLPFVPEDGTVMIGCEYTALELIQEAGLTGEVWRADGSCLEHNINPKDLGIGTEGEQA